VVKDHDFNKLSSTGGVVAIDVRIERLIVTSDGYYFPNLRPYENALNKVRRLHKELSRKKYLSSTGSKQGSSLQKPIST